MIKPSNVQSPAADEGSGFRIIFPLYHSRPAAGAALPGQAAVPLHGALDTISKTFVTTTKSIQKVTDNLLHQSADHAKLTVNQLNKLVDPSTPNYIVTAPPPPKADIELLLQGKEPIRVAYPLPYCLAFFPEALVLGRTLPDGESMQYVSAVQLQELPPKLAKLLGDDAPRIDFANQGWLVDVRDSDTAVEVNRVRIEASSAEEKAEWLDLFAELALKGRGWTRHEAIRGTIWSAVVLDDYELLSSFGSSDVNRADASGKCALHYAAEKPQGGNAVAVLLDMGADANTLDDDLNSPLHLAALAGNALGVHALLRSHADPDAKDLKERTALFCAAEKACACASMDEAQPLVAVLEALAEGGADVEARDVDDKTVLHALVESEGPLRLELLAIVLEAPVCVNPVAVFGPLARSTLHQVVARVDDDGQALALAQVLLEHGARPNAADKQGDSPLMLLLRGEPHLPGAGTYPIMTSPRTELAALLVLHGARLDVLNAAGQTPADAAKAQRLKLDEYCVRWLGKREPKEVATMAADPRTLWNLPRAADTTKNGHADSSLSSQLRSRFVRGLNDSVQALTLLQPESEANFCAGCHKAFSFSTRKVNCRSCGVVFCQQCTSKTFTMSPANADKPVPVKGNVCDACFNQMASQVVKAAEALDRLSKERAANKKLVEEQTRAELFKDVPVPIQTLEQQAKDKRTGDANSAISSTQKAKDAVIQRGEQLSNIAEKTKQMQQNAQDFAANAAKLRKQQEGSWW